MGDDVRPVGFWSFCFLERPGGSVVWEAEVQNRTTNQGLAYLANVPFGMASSAGPFYAGLINAVPAPTLAYTTDTFAAGGHPGWQEYTGYSGSVRPTWTPGMVASINSPMLANAAAMTVTIAASGQIYGGFLVNVASLGTTSAPNAVLFAEGAFSDGVKTVTAGGQLLFNYSLQMRSAF